VHRLSSSFVLAYHGCRREVGERLLGGDPFEPSENDYDWLGSGIYFWEANPARALEWAVQLQKTKSHWDASDPFVVGAVIDLGYCLDLISSNGIAAVRTAHDVFERYMQASGGTMPLNSGGADLLARRLDCAVINYLHAIESRSSRAAFDTVRGVFIEGPAIYSNSGFREKTHIQICVRNPAIIKGVFRIPPAELR
jgi:hypothetical protein